MKRESYLFIDHRASPGVSQDTYRAAGFNMPAVPEGQVGEFAVLVCRHCQQHAIKNPLRERERGFCQKCMEYICDGCVAAMRAPDYVHQPFLAKVEATLERVVKDSNLLNLPPLLKG